MKYTSSRTYGFRISAAIPPWFGTETTLPMSWHNDATTTSLSAPARSARVAVWRQCVSWSTANPSTLVDSICRSASTVSPWCCWLWADSTPIWPHCSAVDSSMRVNVCVMDPILRPPQERPLPGESVEDVAGGGVAVVGQAAGGKQVAQLARGREVLLLVGEGDLFDTLARVEPVDDGPHQLRGGRGP